ncbi:hypothetical protein IPA_05615 [Ignicoccus pacificus DSM 13166]|uniref:Uncharacterized protein n=1 Tax=Ignicoccus pacificus DSM 13166 TaxID=940294 RepID=A0A977KBA6_9CREN|nr:hypothetical protein IPA_05615 [Ignicoccus pacificus DSM 13166]
MPCPWYRDGACNSPRLPKPSTAIVTKRCTSESKDYEICKWYVPPETVEEKKEGLLKFSPTSEETKVDETFEQKYKPYKLIHALLTEPGKGCPYLKTFRGSDGKWYALCRVLNRLLTFTEVKLCEHHWKTCPLYKNAPKLVSEA